MKHPSAYLDWYIHVPRVRYDFCSSGLTGFKFNISLGEVDLSVNYAFGNPETAKLLGQRYGVDSENVFVSSEGASGQNARAIRYLAERSGRNEAIVECPTYEPLLRQVQEHFPQVKRLERGEKEGYHLDADALREVASKRTGLLVLTNPHAPSGAVSGAGELGEIMDIAREYGFHVLCDEIYAEFDRKAVPTVFSVDRELGIVTSSFTKAYGLGGLKLGVVLADSRLVKELYADVLNTVGNSPNVVQLVGAELLSKGWHDVEAHQRKWMRMKCETEEWLDGQDLSYFRSRAGVTYWVKLPMADTHKWMNEHVVPRHSLAAVPGAFFLFKSGYELLKSDRIRLSLGNINPDGSSLADGLAALGQAMKQ